MIEPGGHELSPTPSRAHLPEDHQVLHDAHEGHGQPRQGEAGTQGETRRGEATWWCFFSPLVRDSVCFRSLVSIKQGSFVLTKGLSMNDATRDADLFRPQSLSRPLHVVMLSSFGFDLAFKDVLHLRILTRFVFFSRGEVTLNEFIHSFIHHSQRYTLSNFG